MNDQPDVPTPYDTMEIEAAKLRQTAYLAGEFYRALLQSGTPGHLAEDLVRTWFEDTDELELVAPTGDDD